MSHLRWTLTTALMLGLVSCADTIAPVSDVARDSGPRHLRWATTNTLGFTANAGMPGGELPLATPPMHATAGDSLALNTYAASFWAVRGERRFVQIDYLNTMDPTNTYPFLHLSIANPITRPNGAAIAQGDSVLITVTVDPVELVAYLEPSGLQFGTSDSTTIKIWYTGADGDFNGDGVVDDEDAYIESQMMGVWYQEELLAPWEAIASTGNLAEKWFAAVLEHFSGYAISW